MRLRAVSAIAALTLAGACGVFYTSPSVNDADSFGNAYGTDLKVEVVPLTLESAKAANLKPYVPPRLPLALQPGQLSRAGYRALDDSTQAVKGLGLSAPPRPTAEPTSPPGFVPDRFPPLVEPTPYRIGLSDVLLLSVNANASLEDLPGLITAQSKRQGYIVQDDGAIAIPDAGRVRVAGLTLQNAETEIFNALVNAGIDPSFSLEIAEFNSQRVAVGGAVARPQLIPVTLKPLYLHEAIDIAGGVGGLDPATAVIQLIRGDQVYRIGLARYLNDPATKQVILRDGDSVSVEPVYRRDLARQTFDETLALRNYELRAAELRLTQRRSAAADFEQRIEAINSERDVFLKRLELGAVERPYAYMTGEVRRPSRYALPFERKATLADIMFNQETLGQSFETSDFSQIYLLRASSDPGAPGGLTAYHLNAENAVNLSLTTQIELRPNDVVFVGEQPITSWNRVLSQIVPQLFLGAATLAVVN